MAEQDKEPECKQIYCEYNIYGVCNNSEEVYKDCKDKDGD